MLSVEAINRLKVALIECGRSLQEMTAVFRTFGAIGAEIKQRIEGDPVLLRAWGKQWPKRERRRIGRKIKRMERARTLSI